MEFSGTADALFCQAYLRTSRYAPEYNCILLLQELFDQGFSTLFVIPMILISFTYIRFVSTVTVKPLVKGVNQKHNFLISQPNYML